MMTLICNLYFKSSSVQGYWPYQYTVQSVFFQATGGYCCSEPFHTIKYGDIWQGISYIEVKCIDSQREKELQGSQQQNREQEGVSNFGEVCTRVVIKHTTWSSIRCVRQLFYFTWCQKCPEKEHTLWRSLSRKLQLGHRGDKDSHDSGRQRS